MKLAITIAAVIIAIIAIAASFLYYITASLYKIFGQEHKALSDREALELENSEYNYGHDVSHETYGE